LLDGDSGDEGRGDELVARFGFLDALALGNACSIVGEPAITTGFDPAIEPGLAHIDSTNRFHHGNLPCPYG